MNLEAEFTFNVLSGDLPHGTQPQPLKLTKDSDNAYNAMVTVAAWDSLSVEQSCLHHTLV